jgi:hypothetical protein
MAKVESLPVFLVNISSVCGMGNTYQRNFCRFGVEIVIRRNPSKIEITLVARRNHTRHFSMADKMA